MRDSGPAQGKRTFLKEQVIGIRYLSERNLPSCVVLPLEERGDALDFLDNPHPRLAAAAGAPGAAERCLAFASLEQLFGRQRTWNSPSVVNSRPGGFIPKVVFGRVKGIAAGVS